MREYEEYQKELYNKFIEYVNSMSADELRQALLDVIDDAPEWVYERFYINHIDF